MMALRFRDSSIGRELAEQGYAVRDLLSPEALTSLNEESQELCCVSLQQPGQAGRFLSAGRLEDPALRAHSVALIQRWILPALEACLEPGSARLVAGVHQIKPPGPHSRLNPHQDSSHVDERSETACYAWVPLVDCDNHNGGLQVIPGSHRIGIPQRSLNVPWPLRYPFHQALLRLFSVPLKVHAGQVVFFHSALIHGSGPNRSRDLRLAANSLILPAGSVYRHYFRDSSTANGQVEVYAVSPEFFYEENIQARPSARWQRLPDEPWSDARVPLMRLLSFLLRQRLHAS
jgi:hypothetical protein